MAEAYQKWQFVAANEAATLRCAAWIAAQAEAGWLIFLEGDLGAGKTAFARGLIRAKCGPLTQVPSPSFTLVQEYDTASPAIMHSDFYRLAAADEIDELGILDGLDSHICLIEWAERAQDLLPAPTLRIHLANGETDAARIITIYGPANIVAELGKSAARNAMLADFLRDAGWGDAQRAALAGDASTRRYERLHHGTQTAVLMDWAKGPDGAPIYDGKTYSGVAHLAEAMPAYCRMVDWLGAHGLAAPKLLARNEAQGFALMDDFGDRHLANDESLDKNIFYAEAIANLVHLHDHDAAEFLAPYDGQVHAVEASLFTQYYLPQCSIAPDAAALANWQVIWQTLGDSLMPQKPVTVLRDYHSVNLIWRDAAQGRFRVGLIDVQDALAGHPAYDVASLLCDARIDVDASVRAHWLAQYCEARFGDDQKAQADFEAAFAICVVHRNIKIAGIFIRLAKRDKKPGYLKHLPRVLNYLRLYLAHPAAAPIAAWLQTHAPQALELFDD